MILPKPLLPGSRVRMIGISGCLHTEHVQEEAEACRQRLEALGFLVEMDRTCIRQTGYLSGEDIERADAMNRAFLDDDVDGVWCMKGGWGVNRMLPYVDFQAVREHPKAFIGYSDITSMHLAIQKDAGFVTFHGPMGTSSTWSDEVRASLLHALSGHPDAVFQKRKLECIRGGSGEGEIIGGNLSLLASSLGTRYAPDTKGKILFIEEIGEKVYRIDEFLCHLYLAGKLTELAGLVFGGFTNCSNEYPESGFELEEILAHWAGKAGCPCACGLQCGHIAENYTLPLGLRYRLDADAGVLCLSERN